MNSYKMLHLLKRMQYLYSVLKHIQFKSGNFNLLLPFWSHLNDCKSVSHKDPGKQNKTDLASIEFIATETYTCILKLQPQTKSTIKSKMWNSLQFSKNKETQKLMFYPILDLPTPKLLHHQCGPYDSLPNGFLNKINWKLILYRQT